jgi:hypothetical protein
MKKIDTQSLTSTMINVTKELSEAHKKTFKEKSGRKSLRNSWRRY